MDQIQTYQTNVLQRVGTPEERAYLLEIMAEQLGIPSTETTNPQALACMANAVQRSIQYGWIPGVHMHVISFTRNKGKQNEETVYTLVDGEKGHWDNATRWRLKHGVNWRIQHKLMNKEELGQNIAMTGFQEAAPSHAYGIWARVIIIGQDDPKDEVDPLYSAGLWFGKMKTGNYWNEDRLPTGVTSRDVAIRRADKRALMQSQLTLIPLDDLTNTERMEQLIDGLQDQHQQDERNDAPLYREIPDREEDGDVIFEAQALNQSDRN